MTHPVFTFSRDQLLETFIEFVKIDSPSGQEELFCQYLQNHFKQYQETLGATQFVDSSGNLIVNIPGNTDFVFGITGHMDVVPPCNNIIPVIEGEGEQLVVRSDGTTVLGADDKAALASLMIALDYSVKNNLPRPSLRLLLTTLEEVELQGAKAMAQSDIDGIDFIIAFDTTGPQGTLIHEQPSYYKYTLAVEGKASHAGISPEKGINAIAVLAEMLPSIPQGWADDQTTTNIGFIEGGKALNVVADFAKLQGECRTHTPKTAEKMFNDMKQLVQTTQHKYPNAKINLNIETCFEHYQTPTDTPALQFLKETMESCGLKVNLVKNNGASDLNVFCNRGLKGAVLSAGYVAPHTLHEHVYLKDMVKMTDLLLHLFQGYATWKKS